MQLRKVSPPKSEPNPPNRQGVYTFGPPRYTSGKFKGRVVPTRPGKVTVMCCNRCGLPSYPRLSPFIATLAFDRKTGEATTQYVHARCPKDVAKIRVLIAEQLEKTRKQVAEWLKLPRAKSRSYNARRAAGR